MHRCLLLFSFSLSSLCPSRFSLSLRWLNGPKRKRKNSQCSVKSMTGEYLMMGGGVEEGAGLLGIDSVKQI